MVNIFEETVRTTDLVGLAGYFAPVIILSILLILIARFRGFWASLFFIPAMCAILTFALNFETVTNWIVGFGKFGEEFINGFAVYSLLFLTFHNVLVEILTSLIDIPFINDNIISANWFILVPYVILFLIFFSTCKIRRKRKRDFRL